MKSPAPWFVLLGLLACAALWWTQHQRRDLLALRTMLAIATNRPPAALAAPPPDHRAALAPLTAAERGELLELRGLVTRLAEDKARRRPAPARAADAPAAPAAQLGRLGLPADYRLAGRLEFEGYGTPAAALATLIWAARSGQPTLALPALVPEIATNLAAQLEAGDTNVLRRDFGVVPGFRILTEEFTGDRQARLRVEILPDQEPHEFAAERDDDGNWRLQP